MSDPARENGPLEPAAPSDNGSTRVIGRGMLVGGAGTLLSRLTGLAREVAYGAVFGTAGAYSVFLVVFTIPNLFRRVFGEGALSEAFVPLFNEKLERHGKSAAFTFFSNVLLLTAAVLLAIVVAGALICLLLQQFFPDGRPALVLALLPIMLPYTLFICLFGLLCGVLQSFRHFAAPAVAPVLLNVTLIAATLWLCPRVGTTAEQMKVLAIAVVAAGVLQLAVLWPVLKRFGFALQRARPQVTPDVKRLMHLMIPGVIGASIYQINVMFDRILALCLDPWAAAALAYSERLVYLPVGVFAVALSAASLPLLSRAFAAGRQTDIVDALGYGLRQVFFVSIPCVLVLMYLGNAVVGLIYERGAFDADSARQTTAALMFYAPGIPAFAAAGIVRAGFYSRQDMKTPVRVGVFCLVLNVLLSLALMVPLRHCGLALSTTIAAYVNVAILMVLLKRDLQPTMQAWRNGLLAGTRMLVAVAVAGVAVWATAHVATTLASPGLASKAIAVFLPLAAAAAAYLLVLRLIGAKEPSEFFAGIRRRRDR